MAGTTKLTDRQAEILALLKTGMKPREAAKKLGVTPNRIYQTRAALISAGHLAKPARSTHRRTMPVAATRAAVAATARATNGDKPDPVVKVIQDRIEVVAEETTKLSGLVDDAVVRLDDLGGEATRLEKALHALAPNSNGSRKKTSAARSRRARATA